MTRLGPEAPPLDGYAAALHPTPQMARCDWTDLCGEWDFALDDADLGLARGWGDGFPAQCRIVVPFPPESPASGVHDPSPHPVVWYQRDVELKVTPAAQRVLLHVGASDYLTHVWCNGKLVGQHEGGHTPFACDLTDTLSGGKADRLVLRVADDPWGVSQPRGKQDWRVMPHEIWYPRTTGIWQPVWLEQIASQHITEVSWTPDFSRGIVKCCIGLSSSPTAGERVEVRLSLRAKGIANHEVGPTETTVWIDLALPSWSNQMEREELTWSPESPTLIDAEIVMRDTSGTVIDRVFSYFGFREVSVRDGKFLLNRKPYYLRMALEQGLWPESHLAAPSASALRVEVERAKELGFNGVRVHQKIEDPRFLTWCDRLGLLVWEEMPSCYAFTPLSVGRLMKEWTDAVTRDRSHPCIVCWVPLNESWGVPDLVNSPAQRDFGIALARLTRALDPTRPVISNDGWEHVDSDIWSVHDYSPSSDILRERYGSSEAIAGTLRGIEPAGRLLVLGRMDHHEDSVDESGTPPVMITEFGGLSIAPVAGEPWHGYTTFASSEELAIRFEELLSALHSCKQIGGFCYTQLTDTFQEQNGLLDDHRRPKIPIARVRAAVTGVAPQLLATADVGTGNGAVKSGDVVG
jgi:beta-galactosidase/beta-glucuronidase